MSSARNSPDAKATRTFRVIDGRAVIETLERLQRRIAIRFPDGKLQFVCDELTVIAREAHAKAANLTRPNLWIRGGVALVLGLGLLVAVLGFSYVQHTKIATDRLFDISGLESLVNLLLLVSAGVFFLITIEIRVKRGAALRALHELRSIIHVIDMHQLTKDPSMIGQEPTPGGPAHDLDQFQLVRYLDYCSEMLSLAAKLAALYAQDINDVGVVDAASDIEQLATNLSQKVWQKITILSTTRTDLAQ